MQEKMRLNYYATNKDNLIYFAQWTLLKSLFFCKVYEEGDEAWKLLL